MDTAPAQAEILTIIFIGIFLMLLLALAFMLFFYFSQRKFQAQQIEAQEREIEHREQLLLASIKTQEQERQRLARELHDEVGSKLNVVNLSLHQLKRQFAADDQSRRALQDLFSLLDTTLGTTRRIAHDLLPPTLEKFGLAVALEELCDQYQQASDMELQFEAKAQVVDLDPLTALNFFRVAQELLSNTHKHSRASLVKLSVAIEPKWLKLRYEDNGVGFAVEDTSQQKGLGMQNIESRMRTVKADYQLQSTPGKGVFFKAQKALL